jgi:hypothetical protein
VVIKEFYILESAQQERLVRTATRDFRTVQRHSTALEILQTISRYESALQTGVSYALASSTKNKYGAKTINNTLRYWYTNFSINPGATSGF